MQTGVVCMAVVGIAAEINATLSILVADLKSSK